MLILILGNPFSHWDQTEVQSDGIQFEREGGTDLYQEALLQKKKKIKLKASSV